MDAFLLSSYQFNLPSDLIAKTPVEPRDHSRLMIVNRAKGTIEEARFFEFPQLLDKGDTLVFNDTKVIPARLLGKRDNGSGAEVFLIEEERPGEWRTLVKPGKKLQPGARVTFGPDFFCEVLAILEEGIRLVRFHHEGNFYELLQRYGKIPLPPYIDRPAEKKDEETYQTIYAAAPGAVAAPTAGLHFTPSTFDELNKKGIAQAHVTLHVGLGTFKPIQADDIRQHKMHQERYFITEEAAHTINQTPGRLICVGTTSSRTLESVGLPATSRTGETSIFIYPGYTFKATQALLTNFHLPGSSLLLLVSAFAGGELIKEAYTKAIERRFRFYSYGDAMLIL